MRVLLEDTLPNGGAFGFQAPGDHSSFVLRRRLMIQDTCSEDIAKLQHYISPSLPSQALVRNTSAICGNARKTLAIGGSSVCSQPLFCWSRKPRPKTSY